ncbi:DUF2079 domain-containing protein [Streptococcus caprae]|uniref:DUF2079 domain-containing protein n=1 Tax=Streptococcus caprae TaxID=1640501 RepID=A0ABV8CU36_9STRE
MLEKLFAGKVPYFSREWVLYLVNAYLMYATVDVFVTPVEALFLNLHGSFSLIQGMIIVLFAFCIQVISSQQIPLKSYRLLFIGLISVYLIMVLVKSPSILISFGFLILGFGIYFKLALDKERLRWLIPVSLLLTFPKVIYSLYHGYSGDLGRFVLDYDNWNFSQLWLILMALAYGLIAVILLNLVFTRLARWQSKTGLVRWSYLLVGFLGLSYVIYLSICFVFKVKTLSVSTFDIGIFTQMFESMRREFLPMTTLERDKLLSHFAVHISPIYYLMLPFYMVLPYLETLEVLQFIIVFSGIVPLYLILKKLSLPEFARPMILLWFLVTPALTTAASYHMHENCFLVPLLLWLIYGHLAKWRKRLLLVTLLTLMVKEDAFIYVVSVGAYFLFQDRIAYTLKRKVFIVISQLVVPIVYFAICLYLLSRYGDGAMVARFDNFLLADQHGLVAVLRNIGLNPTYTIASLFTQRKLKYIFTLLLTQAFLPLFQKRWQNYLLLIPLVVINLLSDYYYQADFGFQYSYGTNILVFFMALLALESIVAYCRREKWQSSIANRAVATVVAMAVVASAGVLYSYTNSWYNDTRLYFTDKNMYDAIHATLKGVNKNQRILAYSGYTVDLRETKELYDMFYHNEQKVDDSIDLVVLPQSVFESETKESEVAKNYLTAGYQLSPASTDKVIMLTKPE